MDSKPHMMKPNVLIRWRWAFALGAALQIFNTAPYYQAHDVTGWPLSNAWMLSLVTFGAIGNCALAIMVWVAYFYGRSSRR